MPGIVSVVTAVHAPSFRFLTDAYASLAAQTMPAGWDWQWLVQEDGTSGDPQRLLPADPRISAGSGRQRGQGVARTFALARATGELVKVLDADDLLAPGTLAREIAVMATRPEVGWTTCRVLDLHVDGSTTGFAGGPSEGFIERGSALDYWLRHDHLLSVHPATLCMRRDLLLNLGGWMALPAGEDTGLLLAADAVSTGYFLAEPGLYYRKWAGQITATAAHTESSEWTARNAVIEARARSLSASFPTGWPSDLGPAD